MMTRRRSLPLMLTAAIGGADAWFRTDAAPVIPKNTRKIVVSGFEPFGRLPINSSEKLAKSVAAKAASPDVQAVIVPVVWGAPGKAVKAHWPGAGGLWIAFGQGAEGDIRIETAARNHRGHSRDNRGEQAGSEWIEDAGQAVLQQTYPVKLLAEKLRAAGFPTTASGNAGSYLCEEMLYELLYHREKLGGEPPATVLFIHVPPWQSTVNADGTRLADAAYFDALSDVILGAVLEVEITTPAAAPPAATPGQSPVAPPTLK